MNEFCPYRINLIEPGKLAGEKLESCVNATGMAKRPLIELVEAFKRCASLHTADSRYHVGHDVAGCLQHDEVRFRVDGHRDQFVRSTAERHDTLVPEQAARKRRQIQNVMPEGIGQFS